MTKGDMNAPDTPAHETWDLWQDRAHEPALNMALDEALLLTAAARARPLLRFYAWGCQAVTIGYVQRHAAAPAGFAVIRRLTGGGVVYHDHDFTYTVVVPEGHWLTGLDRLHSYRWINRSVQAGLERCRLRAELAADEIPHQVDRLTMVCFQNPTRYDVLLAGRKVAGSAQRRTRAGLLHQGSLHFGAPLPLPRPRLAEALIEGFRVTLNLDFEPFTPNAKTLALAQQLATEKYGSDAWNQRR
jgi:lipoate-protein ligase A